MANQGSLPFCRSVSVWRSKKDTLSTRTTEKLDLVAYDGHAELRFRFGPSNKMVWFFYCCCCLGYESVVSFSINILLRRDVLIIELGLFLGNFVKSVHRIELVEQKMEMLKAEKEFDKFEVWFIVSYCFKIYKILAQ